jgi:hypothetical protein
MSEKNVNARRAIEEMGKNDGPRTSIDPVKREKATPPSAQSTPVLDISPTPEADKPSNSAGQ